MSRNKSQGSGETIKTIVYAILIALCVRTAAYEPFNIPSGSMIPTLLEGDYLFVSKLSYGYSRYSLPYPLNRIPFADRIFFEEPERGDVAVFRLPTNDTIDYIKRIVGLPGDRIQVVRGLLHVNGKPVSRERIEDFVVVDDAGNRRRIAQFKEVLPNGVEHNILEMGDFGPYDNTPVYVVPEGHYFAMGDNRDSSRDSRFLDEVGFVPRKNLVGRAEFIFFSINGSGWEFWNWPETVRLKRLFSAIN